MRSHVLKIAVPVVIVLFVALPASAYYVTMSKIGEGTVSPNIGANSYGLFKKCTIRATPASGWVFDRWEGDMAGKPNPYTWYVTSDKRAYAIFRPQTPTPANALVRYVGKYDSSTTNWTINHHSHAGYDHYTKQLNSQSWRSSSEVDRPLWEHDTLWTIPWFTTDDVLLLINGGSYPLSHPGPDGTLSLVCLALGVNYIDLQQIPSQPLNFPDDPGNPRTEDEIIAYSLDKYLVTGNDEWPVLNPMVKAVVKAMDMVQQEFKFMDDFLVFGGSKRGWTTWLTAGVDPRVKVIMPLVADLANFPMQTRHHWEAYGTYSSAIQDYVDFDLFCRAWNDPLGPSLIQIVDPYSYNAKFTMPKLIVNASGDQFFVSDSSRYYYLDLPNQAQTFLRYFPNQDHYMSGVLDDYNTALALLDWGLDLLRGTGHPHITWSLDGNLGITVTYTSTPQAVTLWQATNTSARDFRLETIGAAWTSSPLSNQGGYYYGYCPPPPQGWTAYFVECDFGSGEKYTSRIVVNPDGDPYYQQGCFP
ncbi:MAG: hypothetical protein HY706_19180 [Candidatus Hydrogenedentes bacterium]|nr:hypothetical protein [Candidatus Hydrogenedentota bacterium]